jgi:transposase
MLAFVDLEEGVPPHHPLRTMKHFADGALSELSPTFDAMYGSGGRPSIPPERLLKASLLISLYSVCEQLNYDLLWRWFLDMSLMEPSLDQSTFSKNRGRLLKHAVVQQFFDEVVRQADALGLLSDEPFTVDGTLIEAAASLKSFKAKGTPPPNEPPDDPGNPTVNFRGEKRSNAAHPSATDPEARLAKKGRGFESKLAYMGHVLWKVHGERHGAA